MGSFKSYLESKGLSNRNVDRIQKEVWKYVNWLEDQRIESEEATQFDVLDYIREIKVSNITQRTVQQRLGCLKHYYNWQIAENQRIDNPTAQVQIRGVKRKVLYDLFSMQELEHLYASFPLPEEETSTQSNGQYQQSLVAAKRNKVILGLIIYQGLTASDVAKLMVKDLQLREGKIYVSGGRKSNERRLALKSHQVLDLMEYTLQTRPILVAESKRETVALFISGRNQEGLHGVIPYLVVKLRKQHPKLKNLKQVRASVITHWIGMYNLREVQYRAGHRYVSSTESYKENRLEDLQSDIDKYHPIG